MRLIETTPLLPIRLIEHPGHGDQKVHGRRHAIPGTGNWSVAEKSAHIAGTREMVSFHTTEARRLEKEYGWGGRTVENVRRELGAIMGGGEPIGRLFDDFTRWAAHRELAVGLSGQLTTLGATA